jgi:uncharacterized UBP type Zn finger protein
MGLLQAVRSAIDRVRGESVVPCTHLDQIHDVTPQSTGCAECLELGDSWVHLRMCMSCGQVGCCDSSRNKHASRHARDHAPEHQIARSMEPGEDWLWCFTDEVFVSAPEPKA